MAQAILKVSGMSCQHCVNAVEQALKAIGAAGQVDLAAGSVKVEYDEVLLSLDKVKQAIEDQGYDVG